MESTPTRRRGLRRGLSRCGCAVVLAVLGSCGESPTAAPGEPVREVLATFYPVQYFAERLLEGAVPVVCPLPADADPITWQPPREVVRRAQRAALIVANGAEFERWLDTANLPASRLVRSADGFESRFLRYQTRTHSHGPTGAHTHEGVDGHTWFDPNNALLQAGAIAQALRRTFPEHSADVDARLRSLGDDLRGLDRGWLELAPALRSRRLLASHPAYDYWAERYGLEVHNLDLDPTRELTAEQLTEVRAALDPDRPALLLWERTPLPETVATLEAELGLPSVELLPGEAAPAEGDYLSLMEGNIERLRAALSSR
jgi:zinc transport system substrate-binding protein